MNENETSVFFIPGIPFLGSIYTNSGILHENALKNKLYHPLISVAVMFSEKETHLNIIKEILNK